MPREGDKEFESYLFQAETAVKQHLLELGQHWTFCLSGGKRREIVLVPDLHSVQAVYNCVATQFATSRERQLEDMLAAADQQHADDMRKLDMMQLKLHHTEKEVAGLEDQLSKAQEDKKAHNQLVATHSLVVERLLKQSM